MIILIGFKGCGKTTVGKKLAERLGVSFYDTDDLIEAEYKKEFGRKLSFRDIYNESKEIFRSLERKILKKITADSKNQAVISTGGSTPLDSQNALLIKKSGFVVHLTANADILFNRIIKNGIPSFVDSNDPRASLIKLLKKRESAYKKLSDLKVDNCNDVKTAVNDIISSIVTKKIITRHMNGGNTDV
jgi:shikimate kinase